MAGAPSFAVIRAFRLLRIFRIFKLVWFMNEADELFRAMTNARGKIVVFVGVVVIYWFQPTWSTLTCHGKLIVNPTRRQPTRVRTSPPASMWSAATIGNSMTSSLLNNSVSMPISSNCPVPQLNASSAQKKTASTETAFAFEN